MAKTVHHQLPVKGTSNHCARPSPGKYEHTGTEALQQQTPDPVEPPLSTGWRKALQLTLAGLCFALGILGAILPGLPTTPFLLLTSGLLLRSSPKLNAMLLRSRFFGPILHDWQVHRGVRADVKVKAVCGVLTAVCATLYFAEPAGWQTIMLLAAAPIGLVVIARLPTARRPRSAGKDQQDA